MLLLLILLLRMQASYIHIHNHPWYILILFFQLSSLFPAMLYYIILSCPIPSYPTFSLYIFGVCTYCIWMYEFRYIRDQVFLIPSYLSLCGPSIPVYLLCICISLTRRYRCCYHHDYIVTLTFGPKFFLNLFTFVCFFVTCVYLCIMIFCLFCLPISLPLRHPA